MKLISAVLLSTSLIVGAASSSASPALRVVDGDTFAQGKTRLRIVNLDAPDIGRHAKCEAESEKGIASKAYARSLLASASSVNVRYTGRIDRYDRPLVWVVLDGEDFAALMIAGGHGRPWRGRSSDWCE